MSLDTFKKKILRLWKWYVQGYYHCHRCPYAWNDACPGCEDYDCGCVIFGDTRDTCRLLPPIRFLLGWGKKKRFQYTHAHEYDDLVIQYELKEKHEAAMTKAISNSLNQWKLTLYRENFDGTYVPVEDLDAEVEVITHWIVDEYEPAVHPVQQLSLRQEWSNLIRKTWKGFIRIFAPYFTKY